MGDVLTESLYSRQNKQFENIKVYSKSFAANYSGNVIIRDSIFGVVSNYARKKDLPLEVLRYPFYDDELWAFTFVKQGTVFLCVNSDLPLCKQFFATAHELYHIYCFAEDTNTSTIDGGSVLDSKTADDIAVTQEDLEANAFAGLLLMPDALLFEQIEVYGIAKESLTVDDVLLLMDLFAIPYKATVIRLMECEIISKQKAQTLIDIDSETIQKRIDLLGRANQWQKNNGWAYFGTLSDNLDFNIRQGYLTEEREKSDQETLNELKKRFLGKS
jgi:Zn-dependent peptidase ImmA (M78 family)